MENQELSGVLFDFARAARTGLPEAVFCQSKPLPVLLTLLKRFSSGNPPILFTRLSEDMAAALPEDALSAYDYDPVSGTAFAARMPSSTRGSIAIVAAGMADARVYRECARTLSYLGVRFDLYEDCGIAALWRVTERLEGINSHDVVIVVAGMEGALASVLGGLTPKPVLAVPTSVGYGVCHAGQTALDGMLASCAPGISVFNIDNGYGAACAAVRILGLL